MKIVRSLLLAVCTFLVPGKCPAQQVTTTDKLVIRQAPTSLDTNAVVLVLINKNVYASYRIADLLGGGSSVTINYVEDEVPTGAINGGNTLFTLAHAPVAGTVRIARNGLVQRSGTGNDYTRSGAIITFESPPATGDIITVSYIY